MKLCVCVFACVCVCLRVCAHVPESVPLLVSVCVCLCVLMPNGIKQEQRRQATETGGSIHGCDRVSGNTGDGRHRALNR